jgi:hypothetical protein
VEKLVNILSKGDLRSLGEIGKVVKSIKDKTDFERLFNCLYNHDRVVVMRTADAIEKITVLKPDYLAGHEAEILRFCSTAQNKEFMWHLAQLLPRLDLNETGDRKARNLLHQWVLDKRNSRIVRSHALQSLYELEKNRPFIHDEFQQLMINLKKEDIPSMNAKIKKISKLLHV